MEQKYLTRQLAADYIHGIVGLPISAKSMGSMAVRGTGPKFQKFGVRALYLKTELDKWVQSKLSPIVNKTTELKGTQNESNKTTN